MTVWQEHSTLFDDRNAADTLSIAPRSSLNNLVV